MALTIDKTKRKAGRRHGAAHRAAAVAMALAAMALVTALAPEYYQRHRIIPWAVLGFCAGLTVLLPLWLRPPWTRTTPIKAGVALRMAELAAANRELSDEVAHRRQAEERAKTLQQQIEFILGVTKTGLDIIDSQFNLRYIDPEWAKAYGDPAGRKCHEYFMSRQEPCPGCGIPAALETKAVAVTEEVLVQEDSRPIQVTTIPFQDATGEWLVAEVNVDIRDQKARESALRDSEQRLRAILDNVGIGIAVIDADLRVASINRRMRQWFPNTDLAAHPRCFACFNNPPAEGPCAYCPTVRTLEDGLRHERVVDKRIGQDPRQYRTISTAILDDAGKVTAAVELVEDVTESCRREQERAILVAGLEQTDEAVVVTDLDGRIVFVNPAFENVSGYSRQEAIGQNPRILASGRHDQEFYSRLWQALLAGHAWKGHFINRRKNGELYEEDVTISPVRDAEGKVFRYVAIKRDVTRQLQAQAELSQAQKLRSIGRLAAGIAHEICTPSQFLGDNLRFLQQGVADLMAVLDVHRALAEAARRQTAPPADLLEAVEAAERRADLEYLREDVPRAIAQSLEGIGRVSAIVTAMKEFSHPGQDGRKASVDVNRLIRNTVMIARNEWKYVADLHLDLADDLPAIPGCPGELNQVFLNVLVNAAKAIGDVVGSTEKKGQITFRTCACDGWIEVRVEDTGTGIPEEIRDRIFEPFFTTREVGDGTGQGLAISRSVIVDKHGGSIRFETEVGKGTTFIIRLPAVEAAVVCGA